MATTKTWIPLRTWQAASELSGAQQFVGLDVSPTELSAAVRILVRQDGGECPRVKVQSWFWLPTGSMELRCPVAAGWRALSVAGFLTITPGYPLDYGVINVHLKRLAALYPIDGAMIGQWQIADTSMLQEIADVVIGLPDTVKSMAPPTYWTQYLVTHGLLEHDGNPLLAASVTNAVLREDEQGNGIIRRRDNRAWVKIDGALALVRAVGAALHAGAIGPLPDMDEVKPIPDAAKFTEFVDP